MRKWKIVFVSFSPPPQHPLYLSHTHTTHTQRGQALNKRHMRNVWENLMPISITEHFDGSSQRPSSLIRSPPPPPNKEPHIRSVSSVTEEHNLQMSCGGCLPVISVKFKTCAFKKWPWKLDQTVSIPSCTGCCVNNSLSVSLYFIQGQLKQRL